METKDLKLQEILKDYNYIGLTLLHATKDGGIDYLVTNGYRDLESKAKITDDTIFRIASISKIEVAIAIMQLVEKGLINIYDDISKYLGFTLRNPNYPSDIITIEQVMTQTSSISDGCCDVKGYDGVNGPDFFVDLERLLTDPSYEYYTDKTFLKKHPGETWLYSNFGCGILACIIEKVSGEMYSDYIRNHILLPLGIDGSFRVCDIIHQDDIASLYEYDNGKFTKVRDQYIFNKVMFPKYPLGNNFRGPAGGLFISVKDLAKIMLMMMNKGIYNGVRILKEETVNEMERVHWKAWSYDPNYRAKGLQLNLLDYASKETLKGHTGGAYGLRSFMFYNSNNGYILMCNGADYKQLEDHMAKLQEILLTYLVNKFEG